MSTPSETEVDEAIERGGCGAVRGSWVCDWHKGDGLHRSSDGHGGFFFWSDHDDPFGALVQATDTGLVPTQGRWSTSQLAGVITGGALLAVTVSLLVVAVTVTGAWR